MISGDIMDKELEEIAKRIEDLDEEIAFNKVPSITSLLERLSYLVSTFLINSRTAKERYLEPVTSILDLYDRASKETDVKIKLSYYEKLESALVVLESIFTKEGFLIDDKKSKLAA